MMYYAKYSLPDPMREVCLAEEDGKLKSLSFMGTPEADHFLRKGELTYPEAEEKWKREGAVYQETELIRRTWRQLQEYFAGERKEFDIPLAPEGTPFQKSVWEQLLQIPYGETRSYGELAKNLGKPGASRAVGMANHYNPIAILIPCHRVIGANGSLTGYGGGLNIKETLLAMEKGKDTCL